MKNVLDYIEFKKEVFAKSSFFEFLKDQSIDPKKRLSFAPCAAPFIMSFGELNKYVLRDEPTEDVLQQLINQHTYEDDHHWVWFLGDLRKLDLDKPMRFTDVLRFVWGKETVRTRELCRKLIESASKATPLQKLIVIEVIEATAQVAALHIAPVAKELESLTKKTYRYFGEQHLKAESGHAADSPESEELIRNLRLSSLELTQAYEVIDEVFAVFSDFTNELLKYATEDRKQLMDESLISEYDYLIIGAGPAGLQLGYYLQKSNRDYAILEAGDAPGTFFKKYPRHRKLISINKRYTGYDDPEINLRWDWNSLLSDDEEMLFKNYSKKYFPDADSLVSYLGDFADHFDLNIKYGIKVEQVTKNKSKKFIVTDQYGRTYRCKHLVVATGCSKLYLPDICGIELAEKYTNVSIDPNNFENQNVLIIGKGNSAFETADNLIDTAATIHVCSPTPVTMAWKTKYVGHLRAVNNNFLDTYQLKSQNAILDADIMSIKRHGGKYIVSVKYAHANGEFEELIYDRVILCTGFRFDSSIFDETCKPALTINNRYPEQTCEWESSNVKNLYFVGILMHMRDFKKKQSGFIHGFRYNIQTLHRILEHKYHSIPLPSYKIPLSAQAITDFIIERVNTSSSLWQQTDFMCDLITVSVNTKEVNYFDELTKDYIHESYLGEHDHYYTVSLEFGKNVADVLDPFAIDRVNKEDVLNSSHSEFIHPVIRRFCKNNLVAEHHIIEDLASEWKEEVHVQPLLKFMTQQLSKSQVFNAYFLDAGLLASEGLEAILVEQKQQTLARLREMIRNSGWVKERTIRFLVDRANHDCKESLDLNVSAQLGAHLLEANLVTLDQIDQALLEQQTSGQRLGEILVKHGWVTSQTIESMMKLTSEIKTVDSEVAVLY